VTLEATIADIVLRLRQGRYPNEQAISQGVVLRVLQELGWETWDTNVVWPEYQTGEGRVDFALCHPASKPSVFTEVKQPGRAEEGVRQALEYAFHTGVPLVVLTDGRTWSFYLPAEQGSYEDRRVYKLDLYERTPEESSTALDRYLRYSAVQSGTALETARREYRSRSSQALARAAIPRAWRELVEKGDELLVELLTSAVESREGIRPDDDDVAEFLAQLGRGRTADAARHPAVTVPSASHASPTSVVPPTRLPVDRATSASQTRGATGDSPRGGTIILLGKSHSYQTAKEAMVIVLREFAAADPTFLERASQHPDAQGRKRRYIARTPEELYPDREDLRELRESLPGGWWVATNINNQLKRTIIRLACDVSDLNLGSELVVDL
jgi:predicted type IV restriction endonuclease